MKNQYAEGFHSPEDELWHKCLFKNNNNQKVYIFIKKIYGVKRFLLTDVSATLFSSYLFCFVDSYRKL